MTRYAISVLMHSLAVIINYIIRRKAKVPHARIKISDPNHGRLSEVTLSDLVAIDFLIFSYKVSGAISAPFGQVIVPPSIIAFLKKDKSRSGSNIGPLEIYSEKST